MRGFSRTVWVGVSWGILSSVHHFCHVGHPLREEGSVVQVTCQVLHGDVTVEPGLLAAADALGPGHTGLGDGEALLTTVTPLSLSLSN